MRIFQLNKLVRDKIPQLMAQDKHRFTSKIVNGSELRQQLLHKLREEVDEALASLGDQAALTSELADITQAFEDFKRISGISQDEITAKVVKKAHVSGGFAAGAFIESISLDDNDIWVDYYRGQPTKYHEVLKDTYDFIDSPSIEPGVYEHYKGNHYDVLGVACHSESHEQFVVYRPLYIKAGAPTLWIRPYDMFTARIKKGGHEVPRFSKLDMPT